jgi:uncharacterized protein YndB with AHSA1/START domain
MSRTRLSVAAEGTTDASRAAVWALVADANTYPVWGPWNAGGYEPQSTGPARPAMRQWFRYGRTTSRERILEVDDCERIVYTVERGVPVKNYRAEIVLSDTADGTHVSWSAEWDNTLLGRLVQRKLREFYPDMMTRLLAAASDRAKASDVLP